jgi:hypothetical protein
MKKPFLIALIIAAVAVLVALTSRKKKDILDEDDNGEWDDFVEEENMIYDNLNDEDIDIDICDNATEED